MSALLPKADIAERDPRVRFVATSGLMQCSKQGPIRSPDRRAVGLIPGR
jgi:hypothetical protein